MARFIKNIIFSLRIKQWYKNILLFAGIVFSGNLLNNSMWLSAIFGFILFCGLSSIGYIINDIKDRKEDALHPHKCHRPIASGELSVTEAIIFTLIIGILTLFLCWRLSSSFLLISVIYLVITCLYTLYLKRIALVDAFTVATGFVIRAIAGCFSIGIKISDISDFLIICTFLLALFLTFNKRWYSIKTLRDKYDSFYSIHTLDILISIVSSSLLLSYIFYVINNHKHILLISTVFVIYGLFRYIYLIQHLNYKAESENILKDKPLLINIACWVVCILALNKI